MSKENAKKENIVSTPVVATIEKPVECYKANLQKVIIGDVLKMVSDLVTRGFNAIPEKTQASINQYNKKMATIATLSQVLDMNGDIHSVDYARMATICRFIGLSVNMVIGKKKHDKVTGEKAQEGIVFSCKNDGTVILSVLGHKYIASTLIGKPCNVTTTATLEANAETQEADTFTLYTDIDKACSKYLKAKGVPTWNMTQKLDRYRGFLESQVRAFYHEYVTMIESEKANKLN